jgi:hypothetical protein
MGFTLTKVAAAPAFGGHLGKLILEVSHSGSYTRNLDFDLSSVLPRGVSLDDVVIPTPVEFPRSGVLLSNEPTVYRWGPITGCVITSGRAVVTLNPHYLLTGNRVRIRGVLGSTEINGEWTVERLSASTFAIPAVTSITAFSTSAASVIEVMHPVNPVQISGCTTAGVFTATAAHGLSVGQNVCLTAISGLTTPSNAGYLGQPLEVLSVPSSTTFKIKGLTFGGGAYSGTTFAYPVRDLKHFGRLVLRVRKTLAVTSITTATPPVITTPEVNGLLISDIVHVTGALDATTGTAVNGLRRVRTIPSTTTLTLETLEGLTLANAGTHTANTGLISGPVELSTGEFFFGRVNWEILIQRSKNRLVGPTKQ